MHASTGKTKVNTKAKVNTKTKVNAKTKRNCNVDDVDIHSYTKIHHKYQIKQQPPSAFRWRSLTTHYLLLTTAEAMLRPYLSPSADKAEICSRFFYKVK